MNFKSLFTDYDHNQKDKMKSIFQKVKPIIIDNIYDALLMNRNSPAGRPIQTNFNDFLEALYFIIESGSQLKYVSHFGLTKTTFYRYLKLLADHKIIEYIYKCLIDNYFREQSEYPVPLITDTMSIKSMKGSVGLGRNPTDRGRKGIKVSIVCDLDRITKGVHIDACNKHDTIMLRHTLDCMDQPNQRVDCLSDSGYVGKKIKEYCQKKNYNLIAKPRRTRNHNRITHVLTDTDTSHIKRFRNRIELLNQNIRRYRGLMIKWVQDTSIYRCFLFVVLLCISCYRILSTY